MLLFLLHVMENARRQKTSHISKEQRSESHETMRCCRHIASVKRSSEIEMRGCCRLFGELSGPSQFILQKSPDIAINEAYTINDQSVSRLFIRKQRTDSPEPSNQSLKSKPLPTRTDRKNRCVSRRGVVAANERHASTIDN
jgi:hypothetical protein